MFLVTSSAATAFICLLILGPLVWLLTRFFLIDGGLSLELLRNFVGDESIRGMLRATLILVVVSTLLAGTIGSLFAWLNERTDARIGALTRALPVVPLMVPPLAGTVGWILLAAPRPGFLNEFLRWLGSAIGMNMSGEGPLDIYSWTGLIFVYVLYTVPHVYLTVAAGLRNLDTSREEASSISGASQWKTLRRVTLPAIAPTLASGYLLGVIFAFAVFSVPVLLGARAGIDILSVRIVRSMVTQFPPDFQTAILLGLVMVAFVGTSWFLQARLTRQARHATIGGRGALETAPIELGKWRAPARAVMLIYILAGSVMPFAALIVVSLQTFWSPTVNLSALTLSNYSDLFDTTYSRHALRNSILLGVVGACISLLIAALVATYSRSVGPKLSHFIDGVTKFPGAVSNVVMAIGIVAAFVGPPFRLGGTLLILFGGYLALYFPQASVSAGSALAQIDRSMAEASYCCGAGMGRTFRRIDLPMMRPGLAVGWTFVFVLMAGDVTASAMLASTRTPVVGFVMLDFFNNGSFPLLAALGVIVSLLNSSVVVTALTVLGRRKRRTQTQSTVGAGDQPAAAVAG